VRNLVARHANAAASPERVEELMTAVERDPTNSVPMEEGPAAYASWQEHAAWCARSATRRLSIPLADRQRPSPSIPLREVVAGNQLCDWCKFGLCRWNVIRLHKRACQLIG